MGERPFQTLDVLWRGPDDEIEVLGRPCETMEAHGRCPDEHVLESSWARAQDAEHLIAIHAASVQRRPLSHHGPEGTGFSLAGVDYQVGRMSARPDRERTAASGLGVGGPL
jgi:hypothetical protein